MIKSSGVIFLEVDFQNSNNNIVSVVLVMAK